ncbi:MAG: WbqC family protein [Sterolibacterium sp.]|nr:WbqC family protein [Sterolibacterium sp.]
MKLAIMQPYFLPYIGYFQLIAAADCFIVYDQIKYTKKGWINRNRLLLNGAAATFSLPLKNDPDHLSVVQRHLAADFNRSKLLNQFRGAYQRAPCFNQIYPLLERIIRHDDDNLFRYLHHSIREICAYLAIDTEICISSTVDIDHDLKAQYKVIALCQAMHADEYINPIGGLELYDRADFLSHGIRLNFLKSWLSEYPQHGAPFVPGLSIIDVLMFNSPDTARQRIHSDFEIL